MASIGDLVGLATEFGVFEFYLPFIILFALFYGLLSKLKLFGDPFNASALKEARLARAINLVFSLAAAMFLMAYTPLGFTLTNFFATMFGQTAIILTTLIAAGMIIYILAKMVGIDIFSGIDENTKLPRAAKVALIIVLLVGVALFASSGGFGMFPELFPSVGGISTDILPSLELSAQDIVVLALIVLTAFGLWWLIRTPKEDKMLRAAGRG